MALAFAAALEGVGGGLGTLDSTLNAYAFLDSGLRSFRVWTLATRTMRPRIVRFEVRAHWPHVGAEAAHSPSLYSRASPDCTSRARLWGLGQNMWLPLLLDAVLRHRNIHFQQILKLVIQSNQLRR